MAEHRAILQSGGRRNAVLVMLGLGLAAVVAGGVRGASSMTQGSVVAAVCATTAWAMTTPWHRYRISFGATAVSFVVAIAWLVPARGYDVGLPLGFNLEPYRLAIIITVLAWLAN